MDCPVLVSMPSGVEREREGGRTSPPDQLVSRSGLSCGELCRKRPCTAREMTDASAWLRNDTRLVLWSELALLAHLAGRPALTPGPGFRSTLLELDQRLRECAIHQAVDAGVSRRSAFLVGSHGPVAFAGHVAQELTGQLAGEACQARPATWMAPCFCWDVAYQALSALHKADPNAPRHPDSDLWLEQYGICVVGETCADQLARATVERQAARRDARRVDGLIFGAPMSAGTDVTAIEEAVGHDRRSDRWWATVKARLEESFVEVPVWIVGYQARAQRRPKPGDAGR